jgi:ribosomal-protein-alanine N-acetyltransferase
LEHHLGIHRNSFIVGEWMMFEIPTIESERLILRPTKEEDFEPYAAFYETERSHLRGGPLTRNEAWESFAAEIGHWFLRGYGFWSVDEKASGEFCGMVGLYYPEGWPAPEVGYLVWENHEGKGIAYEASLRARAYAFEELGWHHIVSCISEGNTRSIQLAERMGAKFDRRVPRTGAPDQMVYLHPAPSNTP